MNRIPDSVIKINITALAAISMLGEKLPLTVKASCITNVCHKQFGETSSSNEIRMDHSPSGWMNTDVRIRYVTYLNEYANKEPIFISLDYLSFVSSNKPIPIFVNNDSTISNSLFIKVTDFAHFLEKILDHQYQFLFLFDI